MIENKQVLYTEDIPFSAFNKKYIIKRLKELGEKEGCNINVKFIKRIYSWNIEMIFYYLNLCVIEDVLEKIYIRNMYYVRKKIITLNMYHESEIMKELRDKLKNELEELERKTNN